MLVFSYMCFNFFQEQKKKKKEKNEKDVNWEFFLSNKEINGQHYMR